MMVFRRGSKSKPIEAARALGLHYVEQAPRGYAKQHRGIVEVPRGATVKHLCSGEIDRRDLTVFESTYIIMAGSTPVPVVSTILISEAPAEWPVTDIVRRNWLSRLLRRMGRRKGLLLENESFNETFRVTSSIDDFAIALLSPEMQAFLLEKPEVKWRVRPGRVYLIYRGSLKPDRLNASLERLQHFWSLVPDELNWWGAG